MQSMSKITKTAILSSFHSELQKDKFPEFDPVKTSIYAEYKQG
jgi:hypothetical protein